MIAGAVIESLWKEKTRPDALTEAIREAMCELYRGGFDEIKELDEEHMGNSYLNSVINTERLVTDTNSTIKHELHSNSHSQENFNLTISGGKMDQWANDIYIKETLLTLEVKGTAEKHFEPSKRLVLSSENVIDEDDEQLKTANINEIVFDVEEPYSLNYPIYDDYVEEEDGHDDPHQRKLSLALSISRIDKSKSSTRFNNNAAPDSRDQSNEVETGYNLPTGADFKNNNDSNRKRLKQIIIDPTKKLKRLGLRSNQKLILTQEMNHLSLINRRQISLNSMSSSFKKDVDKRVVKNDVNPSWGSKMAKKSFCETSVVSGHLHSRNRSANSFIRRMIPVHTSSFANELNGELDSQGKQKGRKKAFQKKLAPLNIKL